MAEEFGSSSQAYEISAEDQSRISRLYEETQARLLELALIGARVMGFALTEGTVIKFDPDHAAAKERSYEVDVEIICRPPEIGGACACIYRGSDGQWHYESMCGTTSF